MLPADDREAIRQTMRSGDRQPAVRSGAGGTSKAKLEQEIGEAIAKLNGNLELDPMQLDEVKLIAKDFVSTVVEAERVAQERDDPTHAVMVRKEMEKKVTLSILGVLTQEQIDKWRALSDDIDRLYRQGE